MPWLAVADDLTGAHDLGGRLAGRGAKAWVARQAEDLRGVQGALILDAETRFLTPARSRHAVQAAWAGLPGGAAFRFQKIDSTLRGNPGEEVEGLLLATRAPWVAVLPAYPALGRVTRHGMQYVHGVRLDRSEYARDPLTPARALRPVDLFPHALRAHAPLEVVAAGPLRLKAWLLRQIAGGTRFVTFDCTDDAHMDAIAVASLAAGGRHFAGASGLAGALAARVQGPASAARLPSGVDWVVLAGTVSSRSFEQLASLKAGVAAAWVPRLSLQGDRWSRADKRGTAALRACLRRDGALALSSLACREDLAPWLLRGSRGGVSSTAIAERAVQGLVAWGLRVAGPRRRSGFFVTGGHTLAAFFDQARLRRFGVAGEALPGVALGVAQGPDGGVWLASKPGGFGTTDLYARFLRL